MTKISDVLDFFSKEVEEVVRKTSGRFKDQIVLGYKAHSFREEVDQVKSNITIFNCLLLIYEKLMGIKISSKSIKQVVDFMVLIRSKSEEQRMWELKRTFIELHNIQIPNFPNFKISALIDGYEFNSKDIELMEEFSEAIDDIRLGRNESIDSDYYQHHFSNSAYLFDAKDEARILEKYTVYASLDKIAEILSLHLFCAGLSNLRPKGYSFKELPEIPISVMSKIKIEYRNHAFEDGIAVDIDKFNNGGKAYEMNQIETDPNKGLKLKFKKSEQ